MVYEITTDYQDFLAAQRLIIRGNSKLLVRYYLLVWLLPGLGWLAAALVALDTLTNHLSLPSWGAEFLLVFALWSIFLPLGRLSVLKRRYRQMKNGRSASDPTTLKFTETYLVTAIRGQGESRIFRAMIVRFVEDDRVALIYTGKLRYLILPKRSIPEDEWSKIREWMADRFKTKGVSA